MCHLTSFVILMSAGGRQLRRWDCEWRSSAVALGTPVVQIMGFLAWQLDTAGISW